MGPRSRAVAVALAAVGFQLSAVGFQLSAVGFQLSAVGVQPSAVGSRPAAFGSQPSLTTPSFHHLHLNSTNPEAAIEFYTKAFPSTSAGTFAGQPALGSPNNVWVLFNRVTTPPATQPATAFWHFGWHVTDVRATRDRFVKENIQLLPLYTGVSAADAKAGPIPGTVYISSDTYPGTGGVLGLTAAQLKDAPASGAKPARGAGFAYLRGPDDAVVEYQGNMPVERFNHVHMYQDQPYCAALWYQRHLNVAPPKPRPGQPQRTDADCAVERGPDKTFPALDWEGMYRTPSVTTTAFGDVSLFFYMNQGVAPAPPTRGQLMDHIAVSVTDLEAWLAKLKSEGVKILEEPYKIGDTRAFMIAGPSNEAIELVEAK